MRRGGFVDSGFNVWLNKSWVAWFNLLESLSKKRHDKDTIDTEWLAERSARLIPIPDTGKAVETARHAQIYGQACLRWHLFYRTFQRSGEKRDFVTLSVKQMGPLFSPELSFGGIFGFSPPNSGKRWKIELPWNLASKQRFCRWIHKTMRKKVLNFTPFLGLKRGLQGDFPKNTLFPWVLP